MEIDYCERCRGVWLDRGELDKILERSWSRGDSDDDDDYRSGRGHVDQYGKPKKKKSLLSDLFDFG